MSTLSGLFSEPSLWEDIQRYFDRKAGYRYAARVISAYQTMSATEIKQAISTGPMVRKERYGLMGGGFSEGYDDKWNEVALADVICGRCQSSKFENPTYDYLWSNLVAQRLELGWKNSRIHPEFERIRGISKDLE